jgi:prepilin-type N-terminal cleavage/methylation domain-containing protein
MDRRGVTMIEMIAVITVLVGVTGIAVPLLGNDAGSKLGAAAMMLRDDLEQVRYRTLADPSNPLALIVDEQGQGWRITPLDETAEPIERHDGEAWEITFGEGRATGFENVRIESDAGTIWFDARGVLGMDEKPILRLTLDGGSRTFNLGLVTGLVKITSP